MESFWPSCGAHGPLILEVEGGEGWSPTRQAFDRPFLLIGSGPRSDLVLDDPGVSRRHAYLQVIAGRPFCVDLDSRTGTFVDGGRAAGGWLDSGRSVRIGPYRIRAEVAEVAFGDGDATGVDPLSARGSKAGTTTLAFDHPEPQPPIPITRILSLVGRSGRCKVRLATPGASRFHAALLRTPGGIWAVDLRSSDRLAVNGVRVDFARLAAGDELRLGDLVARVGGLASPCPTVIARRADAPTADLRAILEQVADLQHHSNGQFRELIVMVTQLFGSMHRDTMDLVREELEQIRGLAGEMKALREESAARWGTTAVAVPAPGPPADSGERDRPARPRDPGEIHLIVSERLAAFEDERRGRWDKLSWLLSNAES